MRRRRRSCQPMQEIMEQRQLLTYAPLLFDFGTATSAVSSGYTQVLPNTTFDVTRGYGWSSGTVTGVDRGLANEAALACDYNASTDATFSASLPAGTYDVAFQTGDACISAHDQMQFSLQGTPVATINTGIGQITSQLFRDVVVGSDQTLRLRMRDLGGLDPVATVQSLSITPKTTGLQVVSSDPTTAPTYTTDRVLITFNNPVRNDGFTLANIKSFNGPNGAIKASSIVTITPTRWAVIMPQQSTFGAYSLVIDSNIIDANGKRIDQNGNGIFGETTADTYTANFVLAPPPTSYDFGTSTAGAAPGFTAILPYSTYNYYLGYGWSSGTITGADLGTSVTSPVNRDFNATTDGTFKVDMPIGIYNVTLTMGDTVAHDQMGVFFQGVQVDSVSTAANQFLSKTYQVDVAATPLLVRLKDLGGVDPKAVINGLVIQPVVAAGGKFYVSPSGSDTANGSLATPWKTLARAVDQAQAGDVISLRAGTYTGGVYVSKPNITIQAYGTEKAVVSIPYTNSGLTACISFGEAGGKLSNLEITGGYYYGVKLDAGNAIIENCKIHDTGRDGIKIVPGSNDVVIRKTEIYRTGRRESNADGIDNVGGDRMLVQDCYIHDVVGYGVFGKGGARDVIIERNRIRNAMAGVYIGGFTDTEFMDLATNPELYESIDCVVRNNTIDNTDYAGVGFAAALRGQVYGNILTNTGMIGQGSIFFAAVEHYDISPTEPIRITPNKDALISNNIVARTLARTRPMVYLADGSFIGTLTMDYNQYNNAGAGSSFWDSRNWEITGGFFGTLKQWRVYMQVDTNSTDLGAQP